jgi:hypothetical protein
MRDNEHRRSREKTKNPYLVLRTICGVHHTKGSRSSTMYRRNAASAAPAAALPQLVAVLL